MAAVDPTAAAAAAQAIAARLMMEGGGHEFSGPLDSADLSNKRKLEEQGQTLEGGEGPTRKRLSFTGPEGAQEGYAQPFLENNGVFGQPNISGGIENGSGECSEMIEVPKTLVGKLIGREGATIKELQTKSKCKIQIDHDSLGDTKKVTVFGTRECVENCKAMIKDVLDTEASGAQPGEATRTVECPAGIVGRIIGRGGETIRSLQTASGAHIVVDQNFPEGVPRKVNVSGRADGVERAVKMITELINGEPGSAQSIIQKYGAGETRYVTCPKAMVGRVIGKGGETIKQMQKTTAASIQIDQTTDPMKITITGKRTAVDQAVHMVNLIINNEDPFGGTAGGAAPAYGAGPRPGFPGAGGGFPQSFPPAGAPYGGPPAGGPYGGYGSFPMQQSAPPPAYGGGYGGYGMYGGGGGYPPAAAPQQYPGYGNYGSNPAPAADPYSQGGGYGGQQYGQSGGSAGGGSAPAASSSVWQEFHDSEGRPFYYNNQTGASQWEKPAEMA